MLGSATLRWPDFPSLAWQDGLGVLRPGAKHPEIMKAW
jgi:hypothetical protein